MRTQGPDSVLDPHHLAQSLTLADAQKMFVKGLSKFLRGRPNLSYFLNHSTIQLLSSPV